MSAKTCRVIVNQAHCFATGGFLIMVFLSLSMGCGSWGGNSIDGNLNWEHFVNKVRVVQTIAENKPDLEEILEITGKLLSGEIKLPETIGDQMLCVPNFLRRFGLFHQKLAIDKF